MQRGPRKTTPRVKDGRVHLKNHRDVWFVAGGPLEVVTQVPGAGYRHVLDEALLREFMARVPDWERVSQGLRSVTLDEEGVGAVRGYDDFQEDREGYYKAGRIELFAWPDPPTRVVRPRHFAARRAIWERLGIGWRDAPELVASRRIDGWRHRAIEQELWDVYDYFDWEVEETEGAWTGRDAKAPGKPAICEVILGEDGLFHVYERRVQVRFERRTAADYVLLHVFLCALGRHVDALKPARWRRSADREDSAERWALRTADRMWDAWVSRPRPHAPP